MIDTPTKVLVVDDMADNRAMIHAILEDFEYPIEIMEAASCQEALAQTIRNDYAVILLDVQMPEFDGFDTAELLRSNDATRHTPIIFVTALSTDDDFVHRGYESGGVDYMCKPLVPVVLINKVKCFVELYLKNRELLETTETLKQEIAHRKEAERDRENLQDEVFKLQKMETVGTLIEGVCHEFNNALAYSAGFVELLRMKLPDETPEHGYAKKVEDGVQRAVGLVRKLLDFCSQSAEMLEPIHMVALLEERILEFKERMPHSIEIEFDIGSIPATILGDEEKICLVINNLLDNAVLAIGEKDDGKIVIRLEMLRSREYKKGAVSLGEGRYVQLSVADNGCGMSATTLRQIFDPFFMTHEVGEGAGLGLSVAYGIAKGHHGDLGAVSKPGSGSTFYLYLPVHKEAESGSEALQRLNADESSNQRVFFFDSEPEDMGVGQALLNGLGLDVVLYSEQQDALHGFSNNVDSVAFAVIEKSEKGMSLVEKLWEENESLQVLLSMEFGEDLPKEVLSDSRIVGQILKPYTKRNVERAVQALSNSGCPADERSVVDN